MCSAPKVKTQPLPKERAIANIPQYITSASNTILTGGYGTRSTVVNPSGLAAVAATAALGGQSVVLGG